MNEPTILVAEDEPVLARDIQKTLSRSGYFVPAVVSSGEEAVTRAWEVRPDLVLLDIALKGEIDALQAANLIRRSLDVPVVYITPRGDPEIVDRATAAGAAGYIQEPEERRELLTIVGLACKRTRRIAPTELPSSGEGVEFLQMFQDSDIGMAIVTPEEYLSESNSALDRLLGYFPATTTGRQLEDLFSLSDLAKHRRLLNGLLQGKRLQCHIRTRMVRKGGETIPVEMETFLVRTPEGDPRFCFEISRGDAVKRYIPV